MSEDKCFRCSKSGKVARLLDAIYGNEIVKICEECSVLEDLPVIRKPSSFQLNESERPYTVHERLARMSGVKKGTVSAPSQIKFDKREKLPGVTLDNLRKPKDYSQILKQREERARKRNQPLDLVDNYNWHIQMARRNRKISLVQLGGIIGERESGIKLIEDGFLPDDADRIIIKLEQYLKINLRKSGAEKEKARIESVRVPARVLSFDSEGMKNLKIHDLARIKEQRDKLNEEERDRELASKIVWQGKSRSERESEVAEVKEESMDSPEEKKSRKSFWNIFKRKKNDDSDEEIIVGDDINELS
jgi:ribosome-binding protein aMBF1 (putative translation factor)